MKPGFYLTETIIYIALSSIFFIMLFQFTNQIYKKHKTITSGLNSQSWSVIDLITRDLQKTNNIKLIERNIIIVSTVNGDVGWELIKNKLYRIEGEYSQTSSKWVDKISSLVNLNTLLFSCTKSEKIISVALDMQSGAKISKYKKDIFIRNREL